MVSYEELCEALDCFNKRRRNEAELQQLENTSEPPLTVAPSSSLRDHAGFAKQPAEDTHEIDADQVVVDEK